MKSLYLTAHYKEINEIKIKVIEYADPILHPQECLIKVAASGVNPSDAAATLGYFQHSVLPRIPGRDFSGTVVKGPDELIGKKVWGTGGEAGIAVDGTQAEFIKLPINAIAEIPGQIDLLTAAIQPLPYVTAYYALVKRAEIKPNETVLVIGALGRVGRAAMSICSWKNCNAIALVRGENDRAMAEQLGWKAVDSNLENLIGKILAVNKGKPVDVVLNTVGNLYWHSITKVLNEFGRIVTIGARETMREITINLFNFYRSNQDLIGINTTALDFTENAKLLNELAVGFKEKKLTPIPINQSAIFPLEQATQAYQTALNRRTKGGVVLQIESTNDR